VGEVVGVTHVRLRRVVGVGAARVLRAHDVALCFAGKLVEVVVEPVGVGVVKEPLLVILKPKDCYRGIKHAG
jgi:hypothetical protein